MKLPKTWTTVTPLSKTIALALFIFLPFMGIYLGIKLQEALDSYQTRAIIIISNPNKTCVYTTGVSTPSPKPTPSVKPSPSPSPSPTPGHTSPAKPKK